MGYGSSGRKPIEFAGKTGHSEFMDDESKEFLSECRIPQEDVSIRDLQDLIHPFEKVDSNIKYVIAIDGGYSYIIPKKRYPSSKLVAIKVGALLLDITKIKELEEEPFISPEKMNEIKDMGKTKFLLPVKNLIHPNYETFTDFVRGTIHEFFSKKDFNLAEALKWLVYREFTNSPVEEWNLATYPYNKEIRNIKLKRRDFDENFRIIKKDNEIIYITDILRLHELIDEDIGAEGIVNYLLSAVEQMLMVSIIKEIYTKNPSKLSEFLFILDRPLAFFGQTANLHKPMRELIAYFSSKGINLNIVGLEKSGAFVEHAKEIIESGFLKKGQYILLSNEYIYKNILPKTAKNDAVYGRTTYYGGKLVFYSNNGNSNVCTIPTLDYELIKEPKPENFVSLSPILSMIENLKCDMYENAILPITLINKAVSISKYPGEVSIESFVKDIIQNKK